MLIRIQNKTKCAQCTWVERRLKATHYIREDRGEVGNQVTRVPARAGVGVVVVTSVSVAMVPPPRTAYTNRVKEAAIHTILVLLSLKSQYN